MNPPNQEQKLASDGLISSTADEFTEIPDFDVIDVSGCMSSTDQPTP